MARRSMTRRDFVKASAAGGAGALIPSAITSQTAGRPRAEKVQPNVLLMMTDQHSARVLLSRGHPHVRTPHLDRLARGGVTFENAICTYPVCTASRGSIVTGRWPHVRGPHLNVGSTESDANKGLQPDAIMTETVLSERGYRTTHQGKWHIGDLSRHACYAGSGHYHREHWKALQEWRKTHPVDAPPGDAELYGWPLYMTEPVKAAHEAWAKSAQDISLIGRVALPLEIDKTTWVTDRVIGDLRESEGHPFMATWSVAPRTHFGPSRTRTTAASTHATLSCRLARPAHPISTANRRRALLTSSARTG